MNARALVSTTLIAAVLLSALSVSAKQGREELLSALDFNHDGFLDETEIRIGLQYRFKPDSVDLIRLQKQGKATQEDLGALDPSIEVRYREFQIDFADDNNNPFLQNRFAISRAYSTKPISPDRFGITELPIAAETNTASRYLLTAKTLGDALRIRRSAEELLVSEGVAEGALFSYTNDFKNKTETWAAHGAVGFELEFKKNNNFGRPNDAKNWRGPIDLQTGELEGAGLERFYFRPSVVFDRVTTSRTHTGDEDSLVFRFGAGAFYTLPGAGPDSWIQSIKPELDAKYDTDFSGAKKIVGGELSVLLLSDRLGLDAFRQVGPFKYASSLLLHVEGSNVVSDGGDPALQNTNDIFRAGAMFGIRVVPAKFTQLAFGASYKYYPSLVSDSYGLALLNAYLEWDVLKTNHLSVKLNYDRGRTQDRRQRDDVLTVGLGIRY